MAGDFLAVRAELIALHDHMQNGHGVSPDMDYAKTDPDQMDHAVLRRWCKRYEVYAEDESGARVVPQTDEQWDVMRAGAKQRQGTCGDDSCVGLPALIKNRAKLYKTVKDLTPPRIPGKGKVQSVTPTPLSVHMKMGTPGSN